MKETLPLDPVSRGATIISKAESVDLDPRLLYEAVIDLSSEGLVTANCINLAAGILLEDLGLPNYFFKNIKKEALKHLLGSIATSIKVQADSVVLFGSVAHVDFDLGQGNDLQKVRIATVETRDSMESMLESLIPGHRREYYYSPKKEYYTYIIRPETVNDFSQEDFKASRFLFNLAGDYIATPEPTRRRYEAFLAASQKSVTPLIEAFNLPATGETRFMFNSDFSSPQLPILRRILEDHRLTLIRAYWEPYYNRSRVPSSICSLYIQGELSSRQESAVTRDLQDFLAFNVNSITRLYVNGTLSFREMLFAGNAIDFTHLFIFNESENETDKEIMSSLVSKDHRESFAARIQDSNKSTYASSWISSTVASNPDLIKTLYALFEGRFNPEAGTRLSVEDIDKAFESFRRTITTRFIDFDLGYDIFRFMFKIVSCTLKTNFFKTGKRSFSFRFDNTILDPLVFDRFVFGIFFVNGHYACGTHLRADDIARGGLRLIRVSEANHSRELDNAVLLNYALGPKAQRLKHKDICESGSKGVVVPHPIYAVYSMDALYDYTEGILDLILPDREVVDYHGQPEMIFFGPDEGTAPLMDAVSFRAKERGYRHWRTVTTGKSFGIPHDTYGLLESGELFGLFNREEAGTELQIDGKSIVTTHDMTEILSVIGGRIATSGMTTTCVMSTFRTLINSYGADEESLNLMMTGGPDGDLGANEIQCYKGKICGIIDGGSVLFDPDGLDRDELTKIAFMRHTSPRANSLTFAEDRLGPRGFRVPLGARNVTLPDGTLVEDGAMFHRTFLVDPDNRRFIEQADIQAFIPCGGFKDTINHGNVRQFLSLFRELRFIVEGANVFFEDAARRHIATQTSIKQIKDSTANKGGVFSSSIAEVLTAFLLKEAYEEKLLKDTRTRWALTRDILELVETYARKETQTLIRIHEKDPSMPLFDLSEKTSEQIFSLQAVFMERLDDILKKKDVLEKVLELYIPPVLVRSLGMETILSILNSEELTTYRDAIVTKKLASTAFYRFGHDWDTFLETVETDIHEAVSMTVA